MPMTYLDAVQHLTDYLGGNADDATQRPLRRAVAAALREVSAAFPWSCFYTPGWVNVHPQFQGDGATVTVTYTAATQIWTLAGSTWPTWAKDGVLRINPSSGRGDFPIFRALTGTTLQADPVINPGQDISAIAFTLYQDTYPLPVNFRRMGLLYPSGTMVRPTTAAGINETNRMYGAGGTPYQFATIQDPKRPGRMALKMSSWPTMYDTVFYTYVRDPRVLNYNGMSARDRAGTVTISGTTVTGAGTQFEAGQVGSVFRAANNAKAFPSDATGGNPFAVEDMIVAVDPVGQTLTLLENTINLSAPVNYTISDPIDVSFNLYNVFLRCCEKQAEIVRQRDGAGKGDVMALYEDALADAKIADKRDFAKMNLGGYISPSRNELAQLRPFQDTN